MYQNYIWKYRTEEKEKVEQLKNDLNISIPLCNILVQRGIDSFSKAKTFFRPQLSGLHDPFLMKDMPKAVNRLSEAITKKEKILIYGDYDVDGTTAVSLVFSFLKKYYDNLDFYLPDRNIEGYGISFQGIDYAKTINATLIIALDCGIKAHEKVDYANKNCIDFIICDHHEPDKKLPSAFAILNPKRLDCNYPYKELSGCGIGFKFMQAFTIQNGIDEKKVFQFLDLLVISIGADIVPMTGENRILSFYGLKKLNESPIPGVEALISTSQIQKDTFNITDVVFVLAPRINAAGRLAHAKAVVSLLIEQNKTLAIKKAQHLEDQNILRKNIDRDITEEALNMIDINKSLISKKTSVVYKKDWHKGVIGIVASRLIEKYYRPTIVLTSSQDKIVGSARSVKGYNIYKAIEACSNHLIQFGGHKYAAGLTMKTTQIEAFRNAFENYVSSTITDDELTPKLFIDAVVNEEHFNLQFLSILEQMAPFGPSNMKPILIIKNLRDTGHTKIVKKSHLKLSVKSKEKVLSGIGFNMANKIDIVKSDRPFDIAFQMNLNEWNGYKNIEMRVKDIKYSEGSI